MVASTQQVSSMYACKVPILVLELFEHLKQNMQWFGHWWSLVQGFLFNPIVIPKTNWWIQECSQHHEGFYASHNLIPPVYVITSRS